MTVHVLFFQKFVKWTLVEGLLSQFEEFREYLVIVQNNVNNLRKSQVVRL